MKIGCVGCGYWGPNIVRNIIDIDPWIEIFIHDIDLQNLDRITRRFRQLTPVTSYELLLKDTGIEAVVIATPVETHFELAKKALEAGKHVMVEKPLAMSVDRAQELNSLAKMKNLTLMVGHTFLFSPPVKTVKDLIDKGEIGKINLVAMDRINLGIHRRNCSVLWDLAPHDISILNFWTGEWPEKISVIGRGYNHRANPEVAFMTLDFPSGALARITISWLSPGKLRRSTVIGSKKMVVYDDTASVEKVKIYDWGVNILEPKDYGEFQLSYRTGNITSPHIDNVEPLHLEMLHFFDCIENSSKPISDGEFGIQVVKIIEAAEKSLNAGGMPVEIE